MKEKDKKLLSDSRIIELFLARDESAIAATGEKYGRLLMRIAESILHDPLDCEECLNDARLALWNSIPPANPRVLSAFAAEIMRRIALDKYKERNAKKRVPSEITLCYDDLSEFLHHGSTVEEDYEATRIAGLIEDFIRALPERRRFVFIERYYFSSGIEDIARELSVSPQTVYRDITIIKEGLRATLERNGVFL